MQLLHDCHLVASGYLGFGLTSSWDAHAYLLQSGSEAILIDSGCGRQSQAIGDRVDTVLGTDCRLVGIALTHSHVDHSGGAADLAERFKVPVYANPMSIEWLGKADEAATGLRGAREAGAYPPDQTLRAVTAVALAGEEITVGDIALCAVATPGHSPDHVVYVAELPSGRAAFTGDLVFAQGRVALLDTPDTDVVSYEKSVRQIMELRPEHLFPGHGAVCLSRGWAHVEAAVDAYDRGSMPMDLLA